MIIWIDGDACPREVKELVFKQAIKTKTPLKYIANTYHRIPTNPLFDLVVVEKTPDSADEHIVSHLSEGDLLITQDIPLAYEAVLKKANVISTKGEVYTEANIRDRLSTRDLMEQLRSSGLVSGGPSGFSQKDKANFANAFDRLLFQRR